MNEIIGVEEGDICNRDGCDGILEYGTVHNCTCFISPPCSNCVDNSLICPECGWDDGE